MNIAQVRCSPACTKLCAIPLLPREIVAFSHDLSTHDSLEVSIPLTEHDSALETVVNNFVLVWTDGACSHQDSAHLRRAGYGVAYDSDC